GGCGPCRRTYSRHGAQDPSSVLAAITTKTDEQSAVSQPGPAEDAAVIRAWNFGTEFSSPTLVRRVDPGVACCRHGRAYPGEIVRDGSRPRHDGRRRGGVPRRPRRP